MMPTDGGLRTGELARLLDVAEHRLTNLIRHRLIETPEIVGGRRVWRPADVEAARRVLVARGVTVAAETSVSDAVRP